MPDAELNYWNSQIVMRKFRLYAYMLIVTSLSGTAAAKQPESPVAIKGCAAFSRDGRSATATFVPPGLLVEIIEPVGKPAKLTLDLKEAADSCTVSFDSEGSILAVGAAQRGNTNQGLHIAVTDSAASKWIARCVLDPTRDLPGPLTLQGFLENTKSLIVTGLGVKNEGDPPSVFVSSMIINLSCKGATTPPIYTRVIPGHSSSQQSQYADAKHNRLWFPSYPQFCPLQSITLTHEESKGPTIDKTEGKLKFCDLPEVIEYPDSATVIMANTNSDRDIVWLADLEGLKGEQLELPRVKFPNGDRVTGERSLSPDGEILAFSRLKFSYGHFDNFRYKGNDIVVVQVRPLRLLAIIKPTHEAYITGFAVNHRDNKATVLFLSEGKWQRSEVTIPETDAKRGTVHH